MSITAAATTVPTVPVVPAVSAAADSSTATNSSTATSATGLNQLDNTQTFLQLLVAQLENQDPTNPADPTQFMTEIAQMTAVQSQTSLAAEEQTVAADSMIGQNVTGLNSTGTSVSGLVDGVLLSSSGAPELEIGSGSNQQTVALTSISQVTAAYAASGGTSTATSADTGTSVS
jgi:flagellar basal-body rod modification protein FlgD